MKLYVWDELDALEDYKPGIAFAHADTKKQAIKAILVSIITAMQESFKEWPDSIDWMRRDKTNIMKELSKELRQKEPRVIKHTQIFGLEIYGSA